VNTENNNFRFRAPDDSLKSTGPQGLGLRKDSNKIIEETY